MIKELFAVGEFVKLTVAIESSGVFDALMGIRDSIPQGAIGLVKEIDALCDPDGHSVGVEFSQEGILWWIEPKNLTLAKGVNHD